MGKGYSESQKYQDRAQTQREHLAEARAAGAQVEPVGSGALARGPEGHQTALEALIASGELTRLIVRPDGRDGAAFTIKATLEGRGPCYLHGKVSNSWELPRIIEDVINKGKWHDDKYPPTE